jgi:hypothetical protein
MFLSKKEKLLLKKKMLLQKIESHNLKKGTYTLKKRILLQRKKRQQENLGLLIVKINNQKIIEKAENLALKQKN